MEFPMSKSQIKLRAPIYWMGAKWSSAKWIMSNMPPHKWYVEPFMGSMSVALNKAPSFLDVVNDRDDALVNFFQVMRDHHKEFLRRLLFTPYSRVEFMRCRASLRSEPPHADPIERARMLYVVCWQALAERANATTWDVSHNTHPSYA
jgi:DNA adenine methylase